MPVRNKVGKKYALSHMVYDEVSHVDQGANQDAHVVLMKRHTPVSKYAPDQLRGEAGAAGGVGGQFVAGEEKAEKPPATSPGGAKLKRMDGVVAYYEDGAVWARGKFRVMAAAKQKGKSGGGGKGKKGGGAGGKGGADAAKKKADAAAKKSEREKTSADKKAAAEKKKSDTAAAKVHAKAARDERAQRDLDNSENDKKNIPTAKQIEGLAGKHASLSEIGQDKEPDYSKKSLSEDEVPFKTPWDARLLDFDAGIATYSDGSRYSISGWNFTKTRLKKENNVAKKLVRKAAAEKPEPTAPEKSPGGAELTEDEDGIRTYADGSVFDGENWHNVPEPEDESEEEETDETEDEDEDDAEEEEDEPASEMSKSDQGTVGLDALRLGAELSKSIAGIFSQTPVASRAAEYENVMLNFNRAMDQAANTAWLSGTSVSKRDDTEAVTKNVTAVSEIFDQAVAAAGGEIVTKNDDTKTDIYKGLSPEVADIVKRSEAVLEANEVAHFEGVAKSFTNVPADVEKLGAALRVAKSASPEAYETLTSALSAANAGLADSEVFKSFGARGGDETGPDAELSKSAQSAVDAGTYKTVEEAEVALMEKNPGAFYKSTV